MDFMQIFSSEDLYSYNKNIIVPLSCVSLGKSEVDKPLFLNLNSKSLFIGVLKGGVYCSYLMLKDLCCLFLSPQ